MLSFISGGVRSGKSSFAEQHALMKGRENYSLHYIATSMSTDEEMKQRINHHQKSRKESSVKWVNWERPVDLETLADQFTKKDIVLIDCLTTWLSNELFAGWQTGKIKWESAAFRNSVYQKIIKAVEALHKEAAEVILVSNELFFEPVPTERAIFYYLELLGNLHQEIIIRADAAFLVENGIVNVMKAEEKAQ
jgi:adenosylcobinamide kinase / adenosylcobinamide-phosphate guanylyltransferase